MMDIMDSLAVTRLADDGQQLIHLIDSCAVNWLKRRQ